MKMLVLVAGVTGNIGQLLVPALLERGHQVRGTGRSPDKLSAQLKHSLESFVPSTSYYDIPSLEKACQGVDAVERAGVQHFVPASFTYDWRGMNLARQDSYDPIITFYNHLQLTTSSASPHLTFVLIGVLAEVLFGTPGHNYFTTKQHGPWDPEAKRMEIWGDEDRKWNWTSEQDVARFISGILSLPPATIKGKQFWNVSSGVDSLVDIARVYGEIRRRDVEVVPMGSVEDLRKKTYEAKNKGKRSTFWEYIGWFYNLHTVDGTWLLGELDNDVIGVEAESLKEWLERNPEA